MGQLLPNQCPPNRANETGDFYGNDDTVLDEVLNVLLHDPPPFYIYCLSLVAAGKGVSS